jgi:3-oxoadipate CoA-transferase, alpha subunit
VIDKEVQSLDRALEGIRDGDTVLVSGFGDSGSPTQLLNHLADMGHKDLVIVSNNAGRGTSGLASVIKAGSVRKLIASFPRGGGSEAFDERWAADEIELELVPQGTLSERIRAGGSGIGGFYTPTGVGTELTADCELREFADGSVQAFHTAIKGDFALLAAESADRWGNLVYDKAQRNFGPTMAMAGSVTVAQVSRLVPLGALDPERIVTPGVFVNRVIGVSHVET